MPRKPLFVLLYLALSFSSANCDLPWFSSKKKVSDEEIRAANQLLFKGNIDDIKNALAQGEQVDATDHNGNTALILAALSGQLEVVELLVGQGANINFVHHDFGYTALIEAAKENHLEIVRYLVVQRAHINAADKQGYTALMMAAQKGYIAIVQCLTDQEKIALDRRNTRGQTALVLAALSGQLEVVKHLYERLDDPQEKTVQACAALEEVEKCIQSSRTKRNKIPQWLPKVMKERFSKKKSAHQQVATWLREQLEEELVAAP